MPPGVARLRVRSDARHWRERLRVHGSALRTRKSSITACIARERAYARQDLLPGDGLLLCVLDFPRTDVVRRRDAAVDANPRRARRRRTGAAFPSRHSASASVGSRADWCSRFAATGASDLRSGETDALPAPLRPVACVVHRRCMTSDATHEGP
jgi:hypothetical protein